MKFLIALFFSIIFFSDVYAMEDPSERNTGEILVSGEEDILIVSPSTSNELYGPLIGYVCNLKGYLDTFIRIHSNRLPDDFLQTFEAQFEQINTAFDQEQTENFKESLVSIINTQDEFKIRLSDVVAREHYDELRFNFLIDILEEKEGQFLKNQPLLSSLLRSATSLSFLAGIFCCASVPAALPLALFSVPAAGYVAGGAACATGVSCCITSSTLKVAHQKSCTSEKEKMDREKLIFLHQVKVDMSRDGCPNCIKLLDYKMLN